MNCIYDHLTIPVVIGVESMAKITCDDVLRTYAIEGSNNGEPVYRNVTGYTVVETDFAVRECQPFSPTHWSVYDGNNVLVAKYKWSNGVPVELYNKANQGLLPQQKKAPRL